MTVAASQRQVFSWVLNRTVAILVTLTIGASLIAAFVVTVVPVFSRLSPFKSPTGLAFARLADTLRPIFMPSEDSSQPWANSREMSGASWRGRDRIAALDPALVDLNYLRPDITYLAERASHCTTVNQTNLLISALVWVQHASDDPRAMGNVRDSLHTSYAGQYYPGVCVFALCQCIRWEGTLTTFVQWVNSRCLYTQRSWQPFGERPFSVAPLPTDKGMMLGPYIVDTSMVDFASVDPAAVHAVRMLIYEQMRCLARRPDPANQDHIPEFDDLQFLLAALRCVPFIQDSSSIAVSPQTGSTDQFLCSEDTLAWVDVLCDMFDGIANCGVLSYHRAGTVLKIFRILAWLNCWFQVERDDTEHGRKYVLGPLVLT